MLKETSLSVELESSFHQAIAQRTGLVVRSQDRDSLRKKLLNRMQILKLSHLQDYYLLLESKTQEGEKEWQNLVPLLTNNESYFLRDKEQIKLLQEQILPELIGRKQTSKKLVICSAGCSTGEEPYSLAILLLAILLKELLPNIKQWDLTILGLDIDRVALNIAKKGVYSPWSFRGVDELVKQNYFKKVDLEYHLDSTIKQMVEFKCVNLLQDKLNFKNVDLLICRNVFIYFNSLAIANVLEKFYHALHPSGYLLVGHTELADLHLGLFKKKLFSQSLVYQISDRQLGIGNEISTPFLQQTTIINPPQLVKPHTLKNNPTSSVSKFHKDLSQPTDSELIKEAENLIAKEQYSTAIDRLKQVLEVFPNQVKAYYLLSQIYANRGQHEEATFYCDRILQIDSFALDPHYLLAQIAEEKGNLEEAKQLWKKIIYLDPHSVKAYQALSHIYSIS